MIAIILLILTHLRLINFFGMYMKSVFILQNSLLSFGLDISKIYNPKKYNLYLVVNDFGFNKLKDRGQEHYFSNIYIVEDFSFEKIKDIIANEIGSKLSSLEIVTNAEEAISICGKLRVYFGLEKEDFDRFVDKAKMKDILRNSELLFPKYMLFEKEKFSANPAEYLGGLMKEISFPMFAKPIDQLSCVGVAKIYNKDELEKWCNAALSSSYQYEIDEFIDGMLFHCDSYIKDGQVLFTQVSECSRPCFDFIEGKTKGSIALPHDDADFLLLSEYTKSVFDILGIPKHGVTHLEVFKTKKGELVFLEIGYRSPGILIPAMYRKYLGIDTIESHILLQIDETYKVDINRGIYAAWAAFPKQEGTIKSLNSPKINSEHQLDWVVKPGDSLERPMVGRDYVGTVLLWNKDYHQLRADFDYLNDFVPLTI